MLASASSPWLELVTGGADPSEPLPIVFALHGRGATPTNMANMMRRLKTPARVILPRGPLKGRKGRIWFRPQVSAAPTSRLTPAVKEASRELADVVEEVRRTRPTCGRTTFVGLSQGGVVALAYAAEHPGAVGSTVTMAAWVPEGLRPGPDVEVTDVHGTADRRIPIQWARQMMRELTALGTKARLIAHEGAAHTTTKGIRADARKAVEDAVRTEWRSCRAAQSD
jgi:predicted esterase